MRTHKPIAAATALLSAILCRPALADVSYAINTPILNSANNFRDLAGISAASGGSGFSDSTSNDGVLRTGVFYRSNALNSLSAANQATFEKLGITQIYDLRTPMEINGYSIGGVTSPPAPDVVMPGIPDTNISIFGATLPSDPAVPNPEASVAAATTYMTDINTGFVNNASERAAFGTLLEDLAHTQGPVDFHCSAGKDRAGWTAAILQSIAGVSQNQIMQDYLATNYYSAATINGTVAYIASATGNTTEAAAVGVISGVQSTFLNASFYAITGTGSAFGSMQNYLTQGLGLTQADIYVLRGKMVYYNQLPGQSGMRGNEAAGASLLSNLQNSPLSGAYTDYNYYLQSSIDGGGLGGVPNTIGGQVHADSLAALLNQPLAVESAIRAEITPAADGTAVDPVWVSAWDRITQATGAAGSSSSKSQENGELVGITQPLGAGALIYAAFGNEYLRPSSDGATSTLNNWDLLGGFRAPFGQDKSVFIDGTLLLGYGGYTSSRPLGSNLGTANGSTWDLLGSGTAMLGKNFDTRMLVLTPRVGFRYTQAWINGFQENGTDLALNEAINHQGAYTGRALVDLALKHAAWGTWTFKPVVTLGFEQALNPSTVVSQGMVEGYTISQNAAFDTDYLLIGEVSLQAAKGPFTGELKFDADGGENGAQSLAGNASLSYQF